MAEFWSACKGDGDSTFAPNNNNDEHAPSAWIALGKGEAPIANRAKLDLCLYYATQPWHGRIHHRLPYGRSPLGLGLEVNLC
jgi:hypothetical protein